MVRGHGRRDNQGAGAVHMAGIVAPPNAHSEGGQVIERSPGSIRITTSYGDSPVPGNQSQGAHPRDRKSTRLNSSHSQISYAVFCLKKKKYKQLVAALQQVTHNLLCVASTLKYHD